MGEMIIENNHHITSESGDQNRISKRMAEHFALHHKCNLKIDPELPRMTSRKFNYIQQINLNNYYKPGLTKKNIHCQICEFDINVNKVFLHTISTGHKYNKLFVQIVQNVCENRDIDFIVLNFNWLQCRYCGTMIINKQPHDLINTHVHGSAHVIEKEYLLNDFILRQYGNSPGQRDLLKPVDVLLSNQMDKNQDMKMKEFAAPKAQSKSANFLPEEKKNSILEPTGSTEGHEARETEELLAYINRLLTKESGGCRICCEILLDYTNITTSDVNLQNKNKTKKRSKKCVQDTKVQIWKKSPKSRVVERETDAGAVCQNLLWPTIQETNHQINTDQREADLPCIRSENRDEKHELERVITKKKKKNAAVKLPEADEHKLPRHSSVKEDIDVVESHLEVTKPRVPNFFKLMGLPDKKTTKGTEPTNGIEYKIKNSEPRRGYRGGKVKLQNAAKLEEKTKRTTDEGAACQMLLWPTVRATNHRINTDEHKADLSSVSSEKRDKKHKPGKVVTKKKMKKTTVKLPEADEYKLPRYSSVKQGVDVVKSHSKVTKARVQNFFKLMSLPQKKTTKGTKPTSIIKYKIKNSEPTWGYKGGKVNWQAEAKFNEQEKIRAARDNFVCQMCCKSIPNSKFYLHNHMKGSKHRHRMLYGSSDNIWRVNLPRKYNRAQAMKRMLYEDYLMNYFY